MKLGLATGRTLLERLIVWREQHISERYFILLLSLSIGVTMALLAAFLKFIIHHIERFLLLGIDEHSYLYLILPALGILLSLLFVRYVVRDDISHGVTKVLSAISQRKSRLKPHNTWSSLLASAITIGFGGSVGAESPIVLTGAAFGSNFGRLFRLEQRNLMLLIGCGVAGALGGIFKAPITGLVFVIEVLLLDLTMASVLPLLVSSVSAAAVAYILTGKEILFHPHRSLPYRAYPADDPAGDPLWADLALLLQDDVPHRGCLQAGGEPSPSLFHLRGHPLSLDLPLPAALW